MLRNYDPAKVYVSFAGISLLGFADGEFVKVEFAEDRFSMEVGAGGDVTRVRSRNATGSATVTLQAASPINDLLSAVALADARDGSGMGVFQLMDANGTTLVMAPDAWIRKVPDVGYAVEGSTREWVFDMADVEVNVGGALS